MTTAFLLVLSLQHVSQIADRPPSTAATPQREIVQLVGRDEPERFPEWFRWESALSGLARQRPSARELQLGPDERRMLLDEADALIERWNEIVEHGRPVAEALRARGLSESEMYRELFARELEYRWSVLAARDRLRVRLPPEAVERFEAGWLARMVAESTVTLSGPAIELFFEPY